MSPTVSSSARRSSASGEKISPSIRVVRSPASTAASRSGSSPVCSTSTVQPRFSAARTTWSASSAKYGSRRRGTASPTVPVRPVRSDRAIVFGRYPSSVSELCTRARRSAETNG